MERERVVGWITRERESKRCIRGGLACGSMLQIIIIIIWLWTAFLLAEVVELDAPQNRNLSSRSHVLCYVCVDDDDDDDDSSMSSVHSQIHWKFCSVHLRFKAYSLLASEWAFSNSLPSKCTRERMAPKSCCCCTNCNIAKRVIFSIQVMQS